MRCQNAEILQKGKFYVRAMCLDVYDCGGDQNAIPGESGIPRFVPYPLENSEFSVGEMIPRFPAFHRTQKICQKETYDPRLNQKKVRKLRKTC